MTNEYWQHIEDEIKHFQGRKEQLLSPILLTYLLLKGTSVFGNFIFNLKPNALYFHELKKGTISPLSDSVTFGHAEHAEKSQQLRRDGRLREVQGKHAGTAETGRRSVTLCSDPPPRSQ